MPELTKRQKHALVAAEMALQSLGDHVSRRSPYPTWQDAERDAWVQAKELRDAFPTAFEKC
jgi:hypothetical protein